MKFNLNEYIKYKKPRTKDNYIGVEIECFGAINRDNLAYVMHLNNIKCQIGYDGSVMDDNGDDGLEIKLLVKEKDFEKEIKKVCGVLKQLNIRVNVDCGLHVHLDMRNRNVKESYTKLVKSLPRLTKMVKQHRLNNHYCKLNDTEDFDSAISARPRRYVDPYYGPSTEWVQPERTAINPLSYKKHKTLECRLKEGTINDKEIIKWIRTLLGVIKK